MSSDEETPNKGKIPYKKFLIRKKCYLKIPYKEEIQYTKEIP